MLKSGHSDAHHHKSHIFELVELDELGVFSVIHLVEIVEEVDLSIWVRSLFVESTICSEPKLHYEHPTSLYLFFELKLYHGDFNNHWLLWSQ